MSRAVLILLAALGTAGTLGVPANTEPQWLEVRSPHFVVDTNAGLRQGRDVAAHFEQVRAVFQAAFPKARVDPPLPPTILAVRNEQDLSELLPQFWQTQGEEHPAGYFVTDKEKDYVLLRMDAENAGEQYHILYHEYVHLLESLNFPSLPLWASEGLAEFYGSLRIEGDRVGIGYPLRSHLLKLQTAKKLPLAVLLGATESSAYYNEADLTSVFYSQSWELTDYLLTANHAAYAKVFWDYLARVSKGTDSLAAARQCFGNLDDLAAAVDAFEHQGDFPYDQIKAPFAASALDFSVRPLSPAESAAVRGDFLLYAGQTAAARATLSQAIALNPKLPAPYASLAMMAVRGDDRATALRWLDQAAGLDSHNYLVYYYRAMFSLGARQGPEVPDEAKADLAKCIRLNPGFAEGYRALAQVDATRNQDLDGALELADRAEQLDPGQSQNYLTIGLVLARLNRPSEAAQQARQALAAARTPDDRRSAQQFLEQVERIQAAEGDRSATATPIPQPGPGNPKSGESTRKSSGEGSSLSPVPGGAQPPGGLIAEGTVRDVKCSGPRISFQLLTATGILGLQARDYSQLHYTTTEPLAGDFNPCAMLAGRRIAVRYQPAAGGGELTEIDLEK